MLAEQGLITVNPDAGLVPTPLDITGNPKNLEFAELDAAQLPRALQDAGMEKEKIRIELFAAGATFTVVLPADVQPPEEDQA